MKSGKNILLRASSKTIIGILLLIYGCIESNATKKNQSNHIEMGQRVSLSIPDNSIEFFQNLKIKSEAYWKTIEIDSTVYGFQTQKNTRWNKGLTEEEIKSFEKDLGIIFPEGLKNYYKVMNGVDKPAINIYGSSGTKPAYSNTFYEYPEDVALIKKRISWIYESNNIDESELAQKDISRIFPVFGHRFVLMDMKGGFVLSMYGDDIIYWTDNISKLLAIEIFSKENLSDSFKENWENASKISFWLE
ncbi:MAG: SMI1/KNR4 family protein [Bacteroidota bacterium]